MASIARAIACELLNKWETGKADPQTLAAREIDKKIEQRDQAFARELFFGVIRYRRKLDYYIGKFANLARIPLPLKTILRLGAYQLLMMPNIPEYAVVSETVELAKSGGRKRAAGFVNATLRNIIRNRGKIEMPDCESNPISYLGIRYSYPDWLVRRYLKRYGFAETSQLLEFGNQPAPICFYINSAVVNKESLIAELRNLPVQIRPVDSFPDYYECDNPTELIKSKAFADGKVVIADPAQSLAVEALELRPGAEVWDMFASPGGKTVKLAGIVGEKGMVFASDKYPDRMELLRQNVARCRLTNIILFRADILTFTPRRKFKYILADVPCSCTGTMRRNPDLRWRIQEKDIAQLAANQFRLLTAASAFLADKGRLVYSTCSIEPEENHELIERFLASNKKFRLIELNKSKQFVDKQGMITTRPSKDKIDGIFVAAIEKIG
jgi:16S rRNA (cytosine967-C5)-methyltransferase